MAQDWAADSKRSKICGKTYYILISDTDLHFKYMVTLKAILILNVKVKEQLFYMSPFF